MSKDWHSGHFCCWNCDESLTKMRYVLREEHPYCIKCYVISRKRIGIFRPNRVGMFQFNLFTIFSVISCIAGERFRKQLWGVQHADWNRLQGKFGFAFFSWLPFRREEYGLEFYKFYLDMTTCQNATLTCVFEWTVVLIIKHMKLLRSFYSAPEKMLPKSRTLSSGAPSENRSRRKSKKK